MELATPGSGYSEEARGIISSLLVRLSACHHTPKNWQARTLPSSPVG